MCLKDAIKLLSKLSWHLFCYNYLWFYFSCRYLFINVLHDRSNIGGAGFMKWLFKIKEKAHLSLA